MDLTALRDGDSDETAQAQCTALESTATYTSITGECSYDPTADEYITIPSVFATAAMMETDAGALTQASCAALCAATSGCTAAFHVQELRCFDGFFSCICSSNNDQCWLTTASQGLVQRYIDSSSSACLDSCFGLTCDDWLSLSGEGLSSNPYTCTVLQDAFGCDCSNCVCGSATTEVNVAGCAILYVCVRKRNCDWC